MASRSAERPAKLTIQDAPDSYPSYRFHSQTKNAGPKERPLNHQSADQISTMFLNGVCTIRYSMSACRLVRYENRQAQLYRSPYSILVDAITELSHSTSRVLPF